MSAEDRETSRNDTERPRAFETGRPNEPSRDSDARPAPVPQPAGEINGPKGPEPTRYGDWEKGGRVSDF